MNSFKKLLSVVAIAVASLGLSVSANAHDAKVLKVTGAAEVQLPGQNTWQALTPAMAVPQGATIKTAAGGQVHLETLPGVVATIQAETTVLVEKLAIVTEGSVVTTQEAMLDLKKGNIISTLDPAKKNINRYAVRTPKGVAAARGTVYGVSVNISGTTVATLTGSVTLNLGNGVTVNVPVGMAASDAGVVAAISQAIADSGQNITVAQLLQEAVEAVAANVAANTSAAGGSDTATAVLAAVVSAASAAQPDQAAAFTATAVAAASSSGSATAGNSDAIAAITEAAVRAAPSAAASISESAAKAVVETKVTEAVAAAKANNASPEEVAQAAETASQQAGAQVETIAATVVATASQVNPSVTAETIAASVNAGASNGASTAAQTTGTTVTPPPSVTPPTPASASGDTPAPSIALPTPPTEVLLPPVSPAG